MPKGKPHPVELKARIALEVMHGERTVNEVASDHGLNPSLVMKWVAKAETELSCVFAATEDDRARERELAEHREEVDDLHRKIGELTAECDYLQRGLLSCYGIDIEDVPREPGKH